VNVANALDALRTGDLSHLLPCSQLHGSVRPERPDLTLVANHVGGDTSCLDLHWLLSSEILDYEVLEFRRARGCSVDRIATLFSAVAIAITSIDPHVGRIVHLQNA